MESGKVRIFGEDLTHILLTMKKFLIALGIALLSLPITSFGFNKLGHDIATQIAWSNMTNKAKKNILPYLEGHDLTYYSSWMDYMGYITKTGYSNDWFDHCVPVNKEFQYDEGGFSGDALMATEKAIERLKDGKYKTLDDSTVLLMIKHLAHFLPDMHCPSHVIYNFRPSNYMVTLPEGEVAKFHSIWDSMFERGPHAWSATEFWAHMNYYTKAQKEAMVAGTPREWVHDNATCCIVAYDIVPSDRTLSSREWDRACQIGSELVEKQLVKAGLRLAYVMNMIFG